MLFKKIVSFIAYLVVITMIVFLSGEISLRLFYPILKNQNTEMWRYAAEIKKPLDVPELPFYHYEKRRGNYAGVEIKTNSFGFRDREYAKKKPPQTKRILFVGDSFTLGWGVPMENTYAKRIEKLLNQSANHYEVINMGVGNYNTSMELALLKLKGLTLSPDSIVLFYFINDAESTPTISRLGRSFLKYSYFLNFCCDIFLQWCLRWNKNLTLENHYQKLYAPAGDAFNKTREALLEFIRICKTNHIKLLIVSIPELGRLKNYPFDFATRFVEQISGAQSTPFLDLLPFLKNHSRENLWISQKDGHANSFANTLIAETVYWKMKEVGMF